MANKIHNNIDLSEIKYTREEAEEMKQKLDKSGFCGWPVKILEA